MPRRDPSVQKICSAQFAYFGAFLKKKRQQIQFTRTLVQGEEL